MNDPITYEHLSSLTRCLPEDYEPYGETERDACDCSCGCRWYAKLAGMLGYDWGICTNPASHRCGLLTFEHQGCAHFESKEDER